MGRLQSFLPSVLRCLLNERTTPYYTGAAVIDTNTSALPLSRFKEYWCCPLALSRTIRVPLTGPMNHHAGFSRGYLQQWDRADLTQ